MRNRLLKGIAKRIFITEGAIGSTAFNYNCNSDLKELKEYYDDSFPSANLTDLEICKIGDYISETEGRVEKFLGSCYSELVYNAMQEKEEHE